MEGWSSWAKGKWLVLFIFCPLIITTSDSIRKNTRKCKLSCKAKLGSLYIFNITYYLILFSYNILCLQSLCNACGIRYRKKRRVLLSLDKGEAEKCKKNSINRSNKGKVGVRLKLGLMALGREMGLHRSLGKEKQIMRKLKEEEQAAMLLMALSCGCVYN